MENEIENDKVTIKVNINKDDPIKVITNKIIHSEDKIVNPNIHKLKSMIDRENKKISNDDSGKISANSSTIAEHSILNESTYDSPVKVSSPIIKNHIK